MTRLCVDIPVIDTDRLILRAPRMGDLAAFDAFAASDRSRFVGGPGTAAQRGWDALGGMLGHWLIRGFGWWTLEDRATATPAGRAGIAQPVDWPEPELGWHLFDGFEGRGLAHEAATAARGWWHAQGRPAPISLIAPANTRSRRLAERLGAAIESRTAIRGQLCDIWRHRGAA